MPTAGIRRSRRTVSNVFRAGTGLTARALQQTTGLSVDNTEALGALRQMIRQPRLRNRSGFFFESCRFDEGCNSRISSMTSRIR